MSESMIELFDEWQMNYVVLVFQSGCRVLEEEEIQWLICGCVAAMGQRWRSVFGGHLKRQDLYRHANQMLHIFVLSLFADNLFSLCQCF